MQGMLWLDDDKTRSLTEKAQRAVAYMVEKYGRKPATIFTQAVQASGTSVDGIPVEPMANVLPSHLWLVFGEGA